MKNSTKVPSKDEMNLKRFNPQALQEIIQLEEGGETGLVQSLIEDYSKSCLSIHQEMKQAEEKNNAEALEALAHSLKSSSLLLGLEVVGNLCKQIEYEAHDKSIDSNKINLLSNELELAKTELHLFKGAR